MFNLQGSEIIFILLLALVVLGPEKLPSAIRRFTQTYGELRKMGTGFQTELKSALDEPMREMKETAGLIRDQADPTKIAADADREAMEAERRAQRDLAAERAAETPPDNSAGVEPDDTAEDSDRGQVDEWADPVDVETTSDDTATSGADDVDTETDDTATSGADDVDTETDDSASDGDDPIQESA